MTVQFLALEHRLRNTKLEHFVAGMVEVVGAKPSICYRQKTEA